MSQLDAQFVRTGYWHDADRGSVLGPVITTSTTVGNVVVALLAVVTTMGITHLWNLVVFAHHQLRSSRTQSDGLFYQQQALLRTLPPPSSLIFDWAKLWWVWRRKTKSALTRSSPEIILGLLFATAMLVVGIFSSYVVDSTNIVVLVRSNLCRPYSWHNMSTIGYSQYGGQVQDRASSYTKDCSLNTTVVPDRCKIFVQTTVPLVQERHECPFGRGLCANITLPALSLDSGLVDVNDAFGFNLAPQDRIQYRKRTTCSLMNAPDASTVKAAYGDPAAPLRIYRQPYPGEEILYTYFGENVANKSETFSVSLVQSNVTQAFRIQTTLNYIAYPWTRGNTFEPLFELKNEDTDLQLVAVNTNHVLYFGPVDDPMFAAHRPFHETNLIGENETYYAADYPTSVVACQLQYQFCHTTGSGDHCTPLGPLPEEFSEEQTPDASDIQLTVLKLIQQHSLAFDISELSTLQIQTYAGQSSFIAAVPDDQWLREILWWEQNVWNQIRIATADCAVGFVVREPLMAEYMINDTTPSQQQLCRQQRMRSPGGFVNINVFGLVFIVAFCCVITALDLIILRFLVFLTQFRRALAPRIDAWIQDGVLQLQRHAYESKGIGNWDRINKEVPVTSDSYCLIPLSTVVNVTHDFARPEKIMTSSSSVTIRSPDSPSSVKKC